MEIVTFWRHFNLTELFFSLNEIILELSITHNTTDIAVP